MARDRRSSLSDAAGLVPDGARLGFGGNWGLSRRPVAFAKELIRQGRRDLHLFGVLSGFEVDLMIGAGLVASTTSSYVGLDELGQAPNWQRAAGEGTIDVHEYSEWLITAGYRAANMGLPYLPWLTSRHTDIGRELGLKEVECPFTGTPLLAVRAIELDVAVIHAVRCDAAGNAELALPLDHMYDVDALIARCASTVIVCAEEIGPVDANRVQLVAREVDAVVEAPRGAWPGAMRPLYEVDRAHVTETYLPAASGGDFAGYLERYVFSEAGP